MSLIVNCKTYKNHCALAIFVLILTDYQRDLKLVNKRNVCVRTGVVCFLTWDLFRAVNLYASRFPVVSSVHL